MALNGVHPPYPVILARRLFRKTKRHLRLAAARARRAVTSIRGRWVQRYRPIRVATTPWTWPNLLALALFGGFVSFLFLDWNVRLLTHNQPPEIWAFFDLVTQFGKSDWILVPTGVVVLLGLVIRWKRLRPRVRVAVARLVSESGLVFSSVGLAGLVVIVLKAIFGRARPKYMDEAGVMDFSFLNLTPGYPSFPSGHSATAAALAVTLMLLLPKWRWVFVALALWLGGSRVIVGAHYPSDVIFGFLVGGAIAWFIGAAFAKRRFALFIDADRRIRPKPKRGIYRGAARTLLNFMARLLRPRS